MPLIGHAAAVATLREAAIGNRLHHAWLIAGPEGVGKARFAEAAALWLLAGAGSDGLAVEAEHPVARLIAAGSHPDFKRLERLTKERSDDRARSISIDHVRALQPLFATTPSLSPRRVVIIDAIDDLERAGANALLKNLEEPPAGTTFLLVSHAPGRLLPTILSRCRMLRLARLDEADTRMVLRAELPDAPPAEIEALTRIADGAPGQAVRFAGLDIAGLDVAIERIVTSGDATTGLRVALARALGTKAAQARYEAFLERSTARIAMAARQGGAGMAEAIALWRQARDIADRAVHLPLDPQVTVFEIASLLARLMLAKEA